MEDLQDPASGRDVSDPDLIRILRIAERARTARERSAATVATRSVRFRLGLDDPAPVVLRSDLRLQRRGDLMEGGTVIESGEGTMRIEALTIGPGEARRGWLRLSGREAGEPEEDGHWHAVDAELAAGEIETETLLDPGRDMLRAILAGRVVSPVRIEPVDDEEGRWDRIQADLHIAPRGPGDDRMPAGAMRCEWRVGREQPGRARFRARGMISGVAVEIDAGVEPADEVSRFAPIGAEPAEACRACA